MRSVIEEGTSVGVSRFDISLMIQRVNENIHLNLEYATDLFTKASANNFIDYFETLLQNILSDSSIPVSLMPLQKESAVLESKTYSISENYSTLLSNSIKFEGLKKVTFDKIFNIISTKYPDRVAIVSSSSQVTYQALAENVRLMAAFLQNQGVNRGDLVGACIPRSIEAPIALLGIMMAGAAYIPLDPTFPMDRLEFMIQNAGVEVVLTTKAVADLLPKSIKRVIILEDVWTQIQQGDLEFTDPQLTTEDLAYVMYTSGSTGQPKGVSITHRGIAGLAGYMFESLGWEFPKRVLQHTSLNFDISVLEYISALLCGNTLVLANPDLKAIGEELTSVLIEQEIELLIITPTALATLPEESLPSLNYLYVGGESCTFDLVNTWSPGRHFFNGYGPTENTVGACMAEYEDKPDVIHIGQSMAGASLYILDSRLQALPSGVSGELFISGPGLARGYMGRPDLTAGAFVANPFLNDGSRMYRTGDKVRQLPNGDIEYLGRMDQQVKLRGFRIELGEIEQVLQQHPDVKQATVLLSEEGPSKRLVGFVSARNKVKEKDLREIVKESLPSYMVPSSLVILDSMPLGPTGKVDRQKLKELVPANTSESYVEARTEVEKQLSQIWQDVLGLKTSVSIYDDFFSLGGDSILSLQIVFRAKQAGIQLSVKQLFEFSTIAELATVVIVKENEEIKAEQGFVLGKAELTPIQNWFFEQKMSNKDYFNQSVLIDVPKGITEFQWKLIITRLLEHHDGFRTQFSFKENQWFAEVMAMPNEIPLEFVELRGMDREERNKKIEKVCIASHRGLHLKQSPLLNSVLFSKNEDESDTLLLVGHHLIVDVISWQIVIEDLEQLVEASQIGQELKLPMKTTSWLQWASRLREEITSKTTLDELTYWKKQSQPSENALPKSGSLEQNTISNMKTFTTVMDSAYTQAILQELPKVFNTHINDVLLTAVGSAVGNWSDSQTVRIDIEGHGREMLFEDIDTTRTVGWFTTISPVIIPVYKDQTNVQRLKQVKDTMKIRPRNGIGYGLLSEQLGANVTNQSEISFNYLGHLKKGNDSYNFEMDKAGPDWDPNNKRPYLIDVVGRISDGKLYLNWNYCSQIHSQKEIEHVAAMAFDMLEKLVKEAREPKVQGYSPSDFPIADMTQDQADQMVNVLQMTESWKRVNKVRPIQDCYPQTPIQQGLWFQSFISEGKGDYHVQSVFSIKQSIDSAILNEAFAQVMRKHTILRTNFWEDTEGNAYQLVWDYFKPEIVEEDWTNNFDVDQKLDEYLLQDRENSFSPEDLPQWRVLLVRTELDGYLLVWSAHHSIIDGWSMGLLLNDLTEAYDALIAGKKENALAVSRPYREYVSWLTSQGLEKTETFWREYLSGFEEATPLPKMTMKNVENGVEEESTHVHQVMDQKLYGKLKQFSKENNLTINTVLQGAWAIVLARYSGRQDVVFGTVASGRTGEVEGIEEMVGLFINTLPLRVKLPNEQPVLDWLQGIQEDNLSIRQYEQTPLNLVRGWSDFSSGAPLFETLFVFENYPNKTRESNFEINMIRSEERVSYPLSIVFTNMKTIEVNIQFDTSVFDLSSVTQITAFLINVCEDIVYEKSILLGRISLFPDEKVLSAINKNEEKTLKKDISIDWTSIEDLDILEKLLSEESYD